MSTPAWKRVSRPAPCPVCGKPDWCLVAADGTAAICPRTESPRRCGEAGWFHRLADHGDRISVARRVAVRIDPVPADLSARAARYQRTLDPDRLEGFAVSLGVSAGALTALRVGWSADHLAWSFPMTDPATGRVVGIRLRTPSGAKFAVRGGKDGLFVPAAFAPDDPLTVAEGPTDAAALLDLGFPNAVGRPSCTGGTKYLVAIARSRPFPGVVIVADVDEAGRGDPARGRPRPPRPGRESHRPAGRRQGRPGVEVGRADVDRLVQAAPARRLTVSTTTRRTAR